jgi:dTDP-4-amino-4,6-dideoxygalactose transaminase
MTLTRFSAEAHRLVDSPRMPSPSTIPFNRPVRLGNEAEALRQFLETGAQECGAGPIGLACEALLGQIVGKPALLTTSATHALEMAALLSGIGSGHEVIIPSFTFVSTANAFVLRGAKPIFADVDSAGNLLPSEVDRLRTSRTRAVCVVHYAGNACDMSELLDVSRGLTLIEDAAQAIGAHQAERHLGTFGACGALSFHETKNIGCGEGGALILGDEDLIRRAEILREKGTNRRLFQLGLVDKYTWVDVGSSFVLSEIPAVLLRIQLENFDRVQRRRAEISKRYHQELTSFLKTRDIDVICSEPGGTGNFHLFGLVFPRAEQRTAFITSMRDRGVSTPFHYIALHLSEMGRKFHDERQLPGSERLTYRLARLPLFFNMSEAMVDHVIESVRQVTSRL